MHCVQRLLTVGCRSDRNLNPSSHAFAQGNNGSTIVWTPLLLDRCLWGNAPQLGWSLLPLLKLCLTKYRLVLSIMSYLIVMQEIDIQVNTCYIYHNRSE